MSQFDTTAPLYATYRPGLPDEAVDLLTQRVDGKKHGILLDLGSGTGQVPLALSGKVAEVDVVEQDAGMLDEADKALAGLPAEVRLHNASAEDFTPSRSYRANLVTICRAFHWMDQDLVLSRLDGMTAPDATVAVMGDGSLWTARAEWTDALRNLIQEYLGEERRAGKDKVYAAHNRPYREIVAHSVFGQVEEHTIAVEREWNTDTVIGYLYSTSFAARPLFGDRVDAFERRARDLLDEHAARDGLIEHASFQVVLGRRA
ncbi:MULTISPECIES: class I SAM-dependent methyltransferase [Streptomyces]|uniref:Class I SAM-dependent methyltransferase n=1 Tax=Streptomyces evansiae TaxID=3075535 RepID=A0ABU2QTP9_9ACTN|nr:MULTISPECIES: class I SAM-dependent methyltransferase [unclassified Streptomyces]MDT0407798.1 class I SAM-dependent methyltransferase [Streptomyces sp. DSM 41979]MYQ60880.1 methyltransferase domain-containing protein [Streptomyces sp. SID4926]SCE19704.1 Methyltransferase domain-containing protein [Streptomyces sp. DfronAA-171]